MPAEDALLDDGILHPAPVLEFQRTTAVRARGGTAVLPWRAACLAAQAEGIAAAPTAAGLEGGSFTQAVVHLQPSRGATLADVAAAWHCLGPGGRLLLVGDNRLGIASFARALAQQLSQPGELLANRGRGRIVAFHRGAHPPAAPPAHLHRIADPAGGEEIALAVAPGVFSADAPDVGTALLLEVLAGYAAAPRQILDPGCGAGHLAVTALRRWPAAHALLADADWRAVECARQNCAALGLAERAALLWWDVAEPLPPPPAELVLANPPWHSGSEADLELARAMIGAIAAATLPGARILLVANRRLPYEAWLAPLGRLRQLRQERGFKVLEVVRG